MISAGGISLLADAAAFVQGAGQEPWCISLSAACLPVAENTNLERCGQTVGKIHSVTVAGSAVAIGTRKSSAAFRNSAVIYKLNRLQGWQWKNIFSIR